MHPYLVKSMCDERVYLMDKHPFPPLPLLAPPLCCPSPERRLSSRSGCLGSQALLRRLRTRLTKPSCLETPTLKPTLPLPQAASTRHCPSPPSPGVLPARRPGSSFAGPRYRLGFCRPPCATRLLAPLRDRRLGPRQAAPGEGRRGQGRGGEEGRRRFDRH